MSFEIPLEPLAAALLGSLRAGMVLFLLPLLGGESVPVLVRLALSFVFGFLLAPTPGVEVPEHWVGWVLASGRELMIGALLGFLSWTFLSAPHLAGDIVAQELGLRLAQEVDPNTRVPSTALGRIYQASLLLVFLAVHGHHDVLRALHASFRSFPLGELTLPAAGREVVQSVGLLIRHSLMIVAPLFVVLLTGSLIMALLAKSVPQLNIMVFGYPLRLLGGLLVAILLFPLAVRPALSVLVTMKRSLVALVGV